MDVSNEFGGWTADDGRIHKRMLVDCLEGTAVLLILVATEEEKRDYLLV